MKFLFYLFLGVSFISFGQEPLVKTDSVPKPYLMVIGDTISNNAINLNEIYILPKLKLNTSDYRRRYLILQRKTIKVYPFAKLAAERLESLNTRLLKLKSKRKRKKYARRVQKFVEDEFKPTLKKFTITEGQILIKLIHRQTGETAFDLVKFLRSGWRAFWYNNTAKVFKMSLKIPFDPELLEEDYLIEDILQRQFQNGRLEYQKSYKAFDLYKLSEQWKTEKQ